MQLNTAHHISTATDHDHNIEQSPFTGTSDYVFAAKNTPCLDYSIAGLLREIFTSESYGADGRDAYDERECRARYSGIYI
ncbi:hypothetical protein HYQ44_020284 [Verticillium longisporum]|nr:hypothetical protein HYQ44_020284 [Verticillium longisporum]